MLLPQTKEREYRFKLALRIGLPIFALVLALFLHTLIDDDINITALFYAEATFILLFSIYFILYIIYSAFDIRITEIVSKTFTREYLYSYLKKEIESKKEYTLLLVSIDNLHDINATYGIKNGDRVLLEVAKWISSYIQKKDIVNFPLGHVKSGDFVVGIEGTKLQHNTMLEMMCLKASEFKVDDIEVKISGAITDKSFSSELEYMIENLFESQELNRSQKSTYKESSINPNELESLVINALKNRTFILMTQDIFENDKCINKECFVKLKSFNSKIIYQKSYMKVISKLGLTLEYDLMILEEVINVSVKNSSNYALNISPTSLRNPLFLRKVEELFKESPKNINLITVILSENEYYSHIARYNSILKSLKNFGFKIAIDRLGSIHTSFLYLRDLDIDIVRFDALYSKESQKNRYKSIVDGYSVMAHSKGVKTWLKMIESEEILKVAKESNIDYLQGKYLAPLEKIYET